MGKNITIIGGGPAGLIAAEILAKAGHAVTVHERKPSLGRKFLMAGRGGLNLTHSEPLEKFLTRYGDHQDRLTSEIKAFPPEVLRAWCEDLGEETFVGSTGRVFPKSMKASPLLRAWITRLQNLNVIFKLNSEWTGWDGTGAVIFRAKDGTQEIIRPDALLLATGGASWPSLGSDGSWTSILGQREVAISPLRPANCGFLTSWSPYFSEKFSGQPLKNIALTACGKTVPGEIMISKNGIEGGAVYALSAPIREDIAAKGDTMVHIDLRPSLTSEALIEKLGKSRGRQSFSSYLQKALGLSPVAINLLRDVTPALSSLASKDLAALIKSVPVLLTAPFPIDRAISTAGGVLASALDDNHMLHSYPGVFCAGEMLDWEAPTGGYLLQACFSSGIAAANGISAWFSDRSR